MDACRQVSCRRHGIVWRCGTVVRAHTPLVPLLFPSFCAPPATACHSGAKELASELESQQEGRQAELEKENATMRKTLAVRARALAAARCGPASFTLQASLSFAVSCCVRCLLFRPLL